MSKIILKGFIIVPADDLAAVKAELNHHIALTKQEPGCLLFQVTQHQSDPCRFEVYEEFTDQAAFEYHQQRVKSSRWGKISANVERHYQLFEL